MRGLWKFLFRNIHCKIASTGGSVLKNMWASFVCASAVVRACVCVFLCMCDICSVKAGLVPSLCYTCISMKPAR